MRVYQQALCNAPARQAFVDIAHRFPEPITAVLERYALIGEHEHHCQDHGLSATQRGAYHREHSLPVMAQRRDEFQRQLDSDAVAANSGLGQAMGYCRRHFEGWTALCRIEGAPIANNFMEQALKLIIRGRQNALCFKTPAGAAIADVITSVVATAYQAGVNAFDYLIVLQPHAEAVKAQPERWLPWNSQTTLETEKKAT